LLHELIHARINIDHSLASIGVSKLSNVRAELLTLQAQAHLPAAAIEREALRTRLTSLLTTASNAVGKPLLKGADVSSYAEDTINDLIEEKYAKQTSGRAFGMKQSISNKEVAHAYKNKVERLVINMASDINAAKAAALKVNNIWVFNNLPELESAIVAFYNKLDEIAAPAATAAAAGAAVGTAIGGGAASSVTGNQPGTAPMP